jgi:hypothetical protein
MPEEGEGLLRATVIGETALAEGLAGTNQARVRRWL